MAFMEWDERMSVGLAELDGDHKILIEVINQLDANVGERAKSIVVRQALVVLARYAQFHFAREERVMAACGYAELPQHRVEHREFVQRIRGIAERLEKEPDARAIIVNDELLGFLKDWLRHHILIVDMAYRPVVENSVRARHAARSFRSTDIWWSS
ncbi:MAG: bacteriohemerythrin [Alphaproteobacteria bacterium]